MNPCRNCGKLNTPETNYCRFCGTKFVSLQPQPQFDHPAPRPYAWKTDEFQTQNEARRGKDTGYVDKKTDQFDSDTSGYRPAPLVYQQPGHFAQPFRCPTCSSQMIPRIERRISTAGWITFAVLLVFFFPLFWIGLLIKEDVPICRTCDAKLALGPQR
ncbi:MAG: LITAF-like zinc ribbon domain-containing protein [Pyrinomonadaceae bacterium]